MYFPPHQVLIPCLPRRRILSGLRHRGSASAHFKGEKDTVRRSFLDGGATTDVQTPAYVMKGQPDKVARPACLLVSSRSPTWM